MAARKPVVRSGGQNVQLQPGDRLDAPAATATEPGLMAAADKTKLNGIEEGAQKNVGTNLGLGQNRDVATITSSTGTNVSIPSATTLLAGVMSADDKVKVNGVQAGATANSPDATLLNRANHTGTQTLATISDAGTAARLAANIFAQEFLNAGTTEAQRMVLGLDRTVLGLSINDADSIAVEGVHRVGAAWVGSPFTGTNSANQGSVEHILLFASTAYVAQIFWPLSSLVSAPMYRRKVNGVWEGWQSFWTDKNFNPAEYAKLVGPTFAPVGVTPAISLQGSVAYAMFKDAAGTNLGFVGKAAAAANNAIYLGAYASDIILSTASGYYTQIDRSPPAGDRTIKVPTSFWVGAEIAAANTGTPIITDASTANTLTVARFANGAPYMRFTNAGAFVLTVPANSQQAILVGAEITLRRAANANLTISPAAGVTINPPAGGTLVMTQNMTATLKKVATNEWDLIGQTVAA